MQSAWEERERAGMLAAEPAEWRIKRLEAEKPDASPEELQRLTNEVGAIWETLAEGGDDDYPWPEDDPYEPESPLAMLAEAITAHSNVPLSAFLELLSLFPANCARAVCQNPALSHLAQTSGKFAETVGEALCQVLLSRQALPLPLVTQLAQHTNEAVAQSARLHVALAPEIHTVEEGEKLLTQYWRARCIKCSHEPRWKDREDRWHAKAIELGLAPVWAMGGTSLEAALLPRPPSIPPLLKWFGEWFGLPLNPPPYVATISSQRDFIRSVGNFPIGYTEFVQFLANLQGAFDLTRLYVHGQSYLWENRLHAALKLPLTVEPFRREPWNRSPLDLLKYLAQDGNRFVQWAAQTRLDNPGYKFSWQSDGEV